jgi:hypothetical protein
MDDLRDFLKTKLNSEVGELEGKLRICQISLEALEKVNLDNANYVIHLRTLWPPIPPHVHGEDNVDLNYHGSLANGIKEAERQFLRINQRADIQAIYSIELVLDGNAYSIPENFWWDFKTDYSKCGK